MQSSEGGSDSTSSVAALRTTSSAQAPVVQPVPASQQVTQALSPAAPLMTGKMEKRVKQLNTFFFFLGSSARIRKVVMETKQNKVAFFWIGNWTDLIE